MKNEENTSEKRVNCPGRLGNKIWFPEAKHFFPTIFDSSPNAICQPKRGRFLSLYVILMFYQTFFYKKNHLWFWYIFTKCVEYPASLSKPGSVGKWVGSPVGLILKMVKFHLLINPFLPFLHSDFFFIGTYLLYWLTNMVQVWTILKFSHLLELPERPYTAPLHAHLVRVETW